MTAGRLNRLLPLRAGESVPVAWSFLYFFCLLAGYYVIRPVRDTMGIAGGTDDLPWLFTATFLTMLAAVPLFAWLAARYPRRTVLPIVYGFFIVCLLLFWVWLLSGWANTAAARSFFVWVSVYNLFVVSVFWSFMAEVFSAPQGRRLFAFIAAGGSAGAILGPVVAAGLAPFLGTVSLLPISALLLAVALVCVAGLRRWARGAAGGQAPVDAGLGGGVWEGLQRIAASRYLLGIAAFIVLYTTLSTFLYFQQAELISSLFSDDSRRTSIFAAIDFGTNAVTVALQLFVTHRIVQRLGLGAALGSLPAISLLGFVLLGLAPVLVVLAAFQILRRSANYAVARPARETLFTVVPVTDKYKAKNAIDTLVYRGGDALAGWFHAGLTALGLGVAGVAVVAVPLAGIWLGLALLLGREQTRRQRSPIEANPIPGDA